MHLQALPHQILKFSTWRTAIEYRFYIPLNASSLHLNIGFERLYVVRRRSMIKNHMGLVWLLWCEILFEVQCIIIAKTFSQKSLRGLYDTL